MDLIDHAKVGVGLVMGLLAVLNCPAPLAQASSPVSSDSVQFSSQGSVAAVDSEVSLAPTTLQGTSSSIVGPHAATEAHVRAAYGKLPMHFEANHGQTNPQVKFLARGQGYTIFLTDTKTVLVLRQSNAKSSAVHQPLSAGHQPSPRLGPTMLQMELVGASSKPQAVGIEKLPGTVHYLRGNDPAMWRTDIPTYAKVRNQSVYPGIDLVYYGNQSQLEYDFLVAPGADPHAITLRFEGATHLNVGAQGELVLHTAGGPIRLQKPFLYQEIGRASCRERV